MNYVFHFQPVAANLSGLLAGARVTLLLSLASIIIGSVAGLLVATARLSRWRTLSGLAAAYIEFLRDTPLLVQLVWIYYCMPILLGINLPSFASAVIGLSLAESASIAEIVRAGIQAVPRGQLEASRALGLSGMQTLRKVVLPQALRMMLPPYLNSYVSLLKGTALVAIIAVPDLMFVAQRLSADTFRPIEILTTAAILYFVITFPVVLVVRAVERRVGRIHAR